VLVEREAELAQLSELAAAAAAGRGAAVVVEGPAGIGKSSLLDAGREIAANAGLEQLRARGGELERDFAYGVVRQLFDPLLARGAETARLFEGPAAVAAPVLGVARAGGEEVLPGTDPAGAAVHGLYWLVANLAARAPLLVTVDDLHWLDTASMRFIAYLARRLDELPVLLLTATRPPVEAHARELLERLLSEPDMHKVEPAPLSERGVGELLGSELGASAEGGLGRACHRATGGNPLFVRAVARALETEDGAREGDLPDAGSGAIARSVGLQLANLGDAAAMLARAVAVLGASGELRHGAALGGLSEAEAGQAADALVGARILSGIRPLEFAHPIVRSAVYGAIPPAERARLHLEAARLLNRERADPEAVAPHLLAGEARGDAWVVEVLRAAGARSLERGAPEAAIRSLRRALEEPPGPDVRPQVLAELGAAEVVAAPAEEAIEHLSAALAGTDDPQAAAHLALDLSLALSAGGRWADAVTELERVAASVRATDPELARQLEAHSIIAAGFDRRTHPVWHEHLERLSVGMPAETPSDRLLLGALATSHLILGGRAADAVVPAARAVDGGLVAERSADSSFVLNACLALAIGGDFERCERALAEAFADARLRGSLNGFARVSLPAALLRLQQGRLAEAEGHARDMFEISRERGYLMAHLAHGALLEVQVERGDLDAATELAPEEELPDTFMHNWLLYGRGIVRLAQGRVKEAIADLEELGRREEKWRGRSPGLFAYRSLLARAWHVEGDPERARDLAREELALARGWGTAGPIGRALRVLASLEETEAGLALRRESLDVLDGSGYRLEHAKTLVELGAALRRSGARGASREPLYEGMELAHTCGAAALVERAREELVATGARPRRALRTGVDALTPSEQRVARMAADGMTNREIAATLFVTPRTVEIHLTHTYQKLEISSREQLPEALQVGQP
jgi:DNA-binding CsgD family transcriptional regulator